MKKLKLSIFLLCFWNVTWCQTSGENLFAFNTNETLEFNRQEIPNSYRSFDKKSFNETGFKYSGFILFTELGLGLGVGTIKVGGQKLNNADHFTGFKVVMGYQFNYFFSMGVGLGIDKYERATLAPITLDIRFAKTEGKYGPVINLCGGQSFSIEKASSGYMINPSVGLRYYISEKIAMIFNLGYKWQEQQLALYSSGQFSPNGSYSSPSSSSQNVVFKFVTFNTGFSF